MVEFREFWVSSETWLSSKKMAEFRDVDQVQRINCCSHFFQDLQLDIVNHNGGLTVVFFFVFLFFLKLGKSNVCFFVCIFSIFVRFVFIPCILR